MAANITRTIVKANAYAWSINGFKEDGTPNMEKTGNVEFVSTNPTKAEAFRALRNAGFKVSKDFVQFEVVSEDIYAMTLDSFIEHATPVERSRNGRVKSNAAESDE